MGRQYLCQESSLFDNMAKYPGPITDIKAPCLALLGDSIDRSYFAGRFNRIAPPANI